MRRTTCSSVRSSSGWRNWAEPPRPSPAVEQIAALLAHVSAAPATPDEAAAAFDGARPAMVRRHLETLVLVGELREAEGGRYEAVAEPA
jgi:hypothetical protein